MDRYGDIDPAETDDSISMLSRENFGASKNALSLGVLSEWKQFGLHLVDTRGES